MRETQSVSSDRDRKLREILEDQRARILSDVRSTIRAEREEGAREDGEVQDEAELSEAGTQSELEFALLQMQGETLDQIAEALERLDAGRYGFCVDCGASIPSRRLEALPFATRCTACEQDRETGGTHHPLTSTWRKAAPFFDARG